MNKPVSGNFKTYIEGLIEQKSSIGHSYDSAARVLKKFSIFCMDHYPDEATLSKAMVMQWAERMPNEHVNSLIGRIYPIRQLAKYMIRLGIEAYVIPLGIPGKRIRYVLISLRIRNCKPFLLKLIGVRLICPVLPGISSFPSFFGCCTAADYALQKPGC
jgi:hypothetical protein